MAKGEHIELEMTDEELELLLAELFEEEDTALQDVVQNILDEPIPDAVKRRLLKPLQPRKYRPPPPPTQKEGRQEKGH